MKHKNVTPMKFFSLIAALLVVTLTGCNKTEETAAPATPTDQPTQTSAPITEAVTAASAPTIEAPSAAASTVIQPAEPEKK